MEQEAARRRRGLSAEDKWQIFTEASAKDAKVADVLRRWHIDSSQLARIRTKVKEGALTQLKKGPGRNPKDLVSGARNGAHSCRQPLRPDDGLPREYRCGEVAPRETVADVRHPVHAAERTEAGGVTTRSGSSSCSRPVRRRSRHVPLARECAKHPLLSAPPTDSNRNAKRTSAEGMGLNKPFQRRWRPCPK
jgi:hypothetical protein